MQIQLVLPVAVFGKLSLVKNDPEPKRVNTDSTGEERDLLVPGLFVDAFGVDMRTRFAECPQQSFLPKLPIYCPVGG